MLNFLHRLYNRCRMLSETLVDIDAVEEYENIHSDCIFIGTKIKNRYDEARICINESYNPKRYQLNGLDYKLFGVTLDIPSSQKQLAFQIKHKKISDLLSYNLLLQDYKLSCNNCYFNLYPPLYPLDNHFIKKYIPEFNYEDFICFNPDIPKFQAFSSLNLFLITIE